MTTIYQHGIEFEFENSKDITNEQIEELEKIIGDYLLNKQYKNIKTHRIGQYDFHLEPVWHKVT